MGTFHSIRRIRSNCEAQKLSSHDKESGRIINLGFEFMDCRIAPRNHPRTKVITNCDVVHLFCQRLPDQFSISTCYLQIKKIIIRTVYSPGVAEGTDTLHVLMTSMTDNAISRKGRPTSLSPFSFPTE